MRKPLPFGKFLLLDRIAVGGMAEVFAAKTFGVEGFERLVAIKRILPTMVEDDEFITMFIDEARIAAMLSHASLVQIYELGKHDDTYYIAMEYVPGRDVRLIIDKFRKKSQTVPIPMAVYIMARMCEGLDYAHRKKDTNGNDLRIVHRDISPQNVLVSYEGDVKIIDFGIAKAAGRLQKTQAGILKGKFGYMSPEQVKGLPIYYRSDLYSCGVMLYEMLTGEKLFSGESDFSTLEKVRAGEVRAPSELNPEIPPGLERIVLKALAKERDERYQWCSEFHDDLMRFLYQGDQVYSAKSLAGFMKDEFTTELAREHERQRRWQSQKPEETADFDLSSSSPPVPAPPMVLAAAGHDASTEPPLANGKVRIGPPSAFMTAELRLQDRTHLFEPFEAEKPLGETRPARSPDKSQLVTEAASLADLGMLEVVQDAPTRVKGADVPFDLESRRKSQNPPPKRPRDGDSTLPPNEISTGEVAIDVAQTRVKPPPPREPPAPVRQVPRPLPPAPRAGLSAASKIVIALLAVVIVATVGVYAWRTLSGPATGTVLVAVTPSETAQVTVDGRREPGSSPFLLRLPYGTHQVDIREDGFQPKEVEVRLSSRELVKVDAKLEAVAPAPTTAPAVAKADTSAADQPKPADEAEPSAPAPARAPKADEQQARAKPAAEAPSHDRTRSTRQERAARVVEATPEPPPEPVAEAQPTPITAPAPGGLMIFTSPPGASLEIDGRRQGLTPQKLSNLPGGQPVKLRLELAGYRPLVLEQEAPKGSTETLRLKLQPLASADTETASARHGSDTLAGSGGTARLTAMCLPTAQIYIDGRATGRWTPVPGGNPIEVPAGRHTVICETKAGARSSPQTLVMPAGQTVTYRARVE